MIAVQQGRTEEGAADEQQNIVFLRIVAEQRQNAYGGGQKGCGQLHEGVQLFVALPGTVSNQEKPCEEGQAYREIRLYSSQGQGIRYGIFETTQLYLTLLDNRVTFRK